MIKQRYLLIGVCAVACSLLFSIEAKAETFEELNFGAEAVLEDVDMEGMEEINPCVFKYDELGVAQVDKYLNVRSGAGTEYQVIGKMGNEAVCEILDVEGEWAHILSGEVEGYVSIEYLLTGKEAILEANNYVNTMVKVTADALRVREKPNTDCEVIMTVGKGTDLEIIDTDTEGWVKVDIDGEPAYVSTDYVEVSDSLKTAITLSELLYGEGVSDVRVDICEYAKQFLGNPYVWGGSSLTNGADCSGFILALYKHYGISLPHSSSAQANEGVSVTLDELQPGDLIFYTKGGSINHVTMYLGGGKVIHASSPSTGIRISDFSYRTPYCYRSILQ
jgi:uncharacterized protein YgiM (DUF1202 family)